MIVLNDLKNIQEFISKVMADQVEFGTQTTSIPEKFNASSCGQFIVKDKKQRGVHGTAAAIRVLGGTKNNEHNTNLKRLINYLQHRKEIDGNDESLSHTNNFQKDSQNIIKLSEELYSLSFVPNGVVNTSKLLYDLIDRIIDCYKQRNENGWDYFTINQNNDFQLLPTSFAIMAISVHGDCTKITKGIRLLVSDLEKYYDKEEIISDPTSFAIFVFALYVITFKVNAKAREKYISDIKLKKILDKLWKSKFCTLDKHIEQDVDYWIEDIKSFNVRIPWQLHISALTAHYDSRKFSSIKTQKLLKSILQSIKLTQEFKYDYSGKYMSTRTLSILYETLGIIEINYNANPIYSVYNFYDKILHVLGLKWVRTILRLLFLFLVGYIWIKYTHESDKILDHLAPHVLIAIVVFMLEAGKKK